VARREFELYEDEFDDIDDIDDIDDMDDDDDREGGEPLSRIGQVRGREHLGLSPAELERHPIHELTFLSPELENAPKSPRELVRWAEQRGLSSALFKPATELEGWLQWRLPESLLSQLTVQQCLLGDLSRLSKSLQRQCAGSLAGAAQSYVRYRARRDRLEEMRQAVWARAPRQPLAALAESLRQLYDQVRALPECNGLVDTESSCLVIGEDPPRAVASFSERWGHHGLVQILFAAHAQGRLSTSCSCRQTPFCRHQRVLLEALLDAIHDEGTLAAEIAEVVRVPSWQRLLGALDGVQLVVERQRERLVWRLGRSREGLLVQPALQQQNARGGWSPGRKLQLEMAVQLRRQAPPEDRAALDAFVVGESLHRACGPGAARLRLIEALVDHPRACSLEPPYAPLRVQRAQATLSATLVGEQLELGLSVAGQRVSVDQLAALMLDQRWGVLFAEDQVLLFELPPRACRALQAIARYPVALPPEAHERAAELLSSLSVEIAVELPQVLRGRAVPAHSSPILRLAPLGERGLAAELRVRPLAKLAKELPSGKETAPDHPPGEGPLEIFGSVGQERVWARRDFEQEAERARALAEKLGLAEPQGGLRWQLEGDAALELVHRARSLAAESEAEAEPLVVEWPAGEPWQTRSISPGQLRVKLERLGDWFGIGGNIDVDGVDTSLEMLLAAVRKGRRFVELGPGRFARIESELAAVASSIDDMVHAHGQKLLLGPSAVVALEALALPHLDAAAEWRALRARIEAARELEPEPPAALRAELRPYQREGYRWLARLSAWDAGCCLADDMGLGKTVQCLAVLLSRPGPHLVVAPTSVGPNWLREAQAFAPSLRARLYRGPDRAALLSELAPGDLLVTSYDLLAIDSEAFSRIELDTLVLDEAQAVKNARTQRAQAARAVRARFKLALTGTPVENHLGELWSIFSILSPSLLGPWEHFRDRFAAPIERDGDRGRLAALSRLIRPFMLRRTKAVVAPELPPRTSVIEPVELSPRERALYEAARREALAELTSLTRDERGRIQILAALTRLRRLACHPKLVADDYRGRASKLETLLRRIDELRESGQRALIFSQFTSFLALVRQALNERRIRYLYLDGQTPVAERSAHVDAWQECEADLFLLSLKAGGSGLNLIGADCVIHLDPWWNPAVEDQATDRTHRIGQQRPVTAVRLIAQGTIEEAVIALHDGKRSLADGLLSGTDAAAQLSSAELVDLIRFGEAASGEAAAPTSDAEDDAEPSLEPLLASSPAAGKPGGSKPRSSPGMGATPRADARGEMLDVSGGLDVQGLEQLRQRLSQRLPHERITESTARSYLRAFDCMLDFARSRSGRRSLAGWLDECMAALELGEIDAPQSLPQSLRAVVRRARALTG